MMFYNLIPYEGIELARLGESRSVIRARLNQHRLIPSDPMGRMHDYYPDIGLHIHYQDDVCHFLEFGMKAIPRLMETPLSHRSFRVVREWLLGQDADLQVLTDGVRSLKFGVHIHAPGELKGSDRIESVALFDQKGAAEPA